MAASERFVTDAIKCCILVCGVGKEHQIQTRSVEHNATTNACCFEGDAQKDIAQIFKHNRSHPNLNSVNYQLPCMPLIRYRLV